MLTNTNMLAVNQDKMAVQATRVFPRAQYVARGAVYGAPSVPSYSLPLGQNWAMKPGKAPQSKQLRNLGQAVGGPELNLCLSAGTDGVTLASCEADANHELDWVIVSEPAPPPHLGPGQVRTGDCSTATDWHYIPSGDKVTGGGSLVASSDGSRLMLTDQHCKNVDARPGDRIIVYDPTVGSCGGQLPSNQAFALNGTRLVVQQNGECVSASECDTRDSAAPLSRCITAEVCSDSTATTVGDFLQQWSWLNGTKKLQLLGLGEESGAFECLDVDMNATSTNATAATLYSHESGGCIKLATATDPSKCLGLAAVNGTTEYRTAALVPCSDPTVLWRYGSRYLNMTYGSLSNCHTALSLDASPRCVTALHLQSYTPSPSFAQLNYGSLNAYCVIRVREMFVATGREQTSLRGRLLAVDGLHCSSTGEKRMRSLPCTSISFQGIRATVASLRSTRQKCGVTRR